MKEYNGNSVRYARIKIYYENQEKKPRVRFSYPKVKNPSQPHFFSFIFLGWFIIFIVPFFVICFYFSSILIRTSVAIFMFFLPPLLIEYFFKDYLCKIYPEAHPFFKRMLGKTYFMIFYSKDVIKINKNLIYVEVPIFENVFFDYRVTKDFKKCLKFFEIREHPVKKLKMKHGIKKYELLEEFWYARFYFIKEPKTGKLEIEFA